MSSDLSPVERATITLAELTGLRFSHMERWGFGHRITFFEGTVGSVQVFHLGRAKLFDFVFERVSKMR